MIMFDFLKRPPRQQTSPPAPVLDSVDIANLDRSFEMLRNTTIEVSHAAINASTVLKNRLQESQSRFFSTIDAICDIVITKDGFGRWRTINSYAQDLFQITQQQYFAKTNQELQNMFPHLRSVLDRSEETDERAWKSKQPFRYEEELVRDGHRPMYFDVIKTPIFNEDGSRREMIVIGRDVTVMREKDRRMKACFIALNSASDPIIILDADGKIFFCNDKFLMSFNIAGHESVIGKALFEVIDEFPEYDTAWETIHDNHIWRGVIYNSYDINILPVKNGVPDPIYYICTLKPIKPNDKYNN